MGLDHVKKTYESWGAEDPMYAVLTDHERAGGRWDPEEFFRTGRDEIARVVTYLDGLGIDIRGGRALDFGCGAGRLTQALADYADQVVGVDIAASMVETARRHNRHDSVEYVVNSEPDLSLFDDDVFDFVYSNITLQHIPPRYARTYIREFFRVAKPGGCVLFQMRSGPRIEPGSFRAFLYRLNREYFRHFLQRIRGRPAYEIHFIARSQVEELIADAGGRLVDVAVLDGSRGRNFRYCAQVPERGDEAPDTGPADPTGPDEPGLRADTGEA